MTRSPCVGQINSLGGEIFVNFFQNLNFSILLFLQEIYLELLASFLKSLGVSRVDHIDENVGVLEIVPPVGPGHYNVSFIHLVRSVNISQKFL